ncbi:unnamed protein product [Camellia sinensis]
MGTRIIEGLILDMNLLKEVKYSKLAFSVNGKCRFEEFHNTSLLSNVDNSFKRHCVSIFSWKTIGTSPSISNQIALEVDAFSQMQKLKLLQLNFIRVNGSFVNFPKGLQWLSWHGFPFKSVHKDFSLESMVVLDMHYSRLQKVWEETK